MSNLTANQQAFLRIMAESPEGEADGFSILAGREDGYKYFDALSAAGFFAPSKNQGPVAAENPAYVSIPYWKGLDYLSSASIHAGEVGDVELGSKVMAVVVAVSEAATLESHARDNFHTWRKFAEFAAAVPLESLSQPVIAQIPVWLSSRFDSGTVGDALGRRLLPKLLAAPDGRFHQFALQVIGYVTTIEWKADRPSRPDYRSPTTALDPYWVREITAKHLAPLAELLPRETVELFTQRVRDIFQGTRAEASWLFRPAVEQHEQNRESNKAENILVAGLRDALLTWVGRDPNTARDYLAALYDDELEILKRVAVYTVGARYEVLSELVHKLVDETLLSVGLTHEVYHFLKAHFGELSDVPKRRLIELVFSSAPNDPSDDASRSSLHRKRTWLSAMAGQGSVEVDAAYKDIVAKFGPPPVHADFLSYMEHRWGPGPSGYSKGELLNFLLDGSLIERLNSFTPGDPWNGPTVAALVDELQLAIADNPTEFFEIRQQLLDAGRPYQYAFLQAFMKLWGEEASKKGSFDWASGWPALLDWIWELVGPDAFWTKAVDEAPPLTATQDWIPPIIADFIRAGANSDEHAFAPQLLPNALKIIARLLKCLNSEPLPEGAEPLAHAINQPRGRTLEALFILSLRAARLADRQDGGHELLWADTLAPYFDAEVDRLPTGNVDFVILFGQFLPQMQYLSTSWTEANFTRIFDPASAEMLMLAVSGLAYAAATKPVYDILSRTEVLDEALKLTNLHSEDRARLVERVMHAMLLDNERIDGPRIEALFRSERASDLRVAADWLWSVRGGALEPRQTELIRRFWRRAVETSLSLEPRPLSLLSSLGRMLCFIDEVSTDDAELIVALAAYADSDNHSGWFYLEELDRLADTSPATVARALVAYVMRFKPGYDFERRLLKPTEKIAAHGHLNEAIQITEALKGLPEFLDLYKRIR